MKQLNEIFHALLGPPSRDYKFLAGLDKAAVDATLAASVARINVKSFVENKTPLIQVANVLDSQLSIAAGFKNSKYVYYNGSVFMDCFAPRWPGRIFEKGLASLVKSLARPDEAWRPYIPSLVFSITKKCVYRCEHCYAIHTLGGKEALTVNDMLRIAKDFQKIGVGVMAWEGGDPLLRYDDLLTLIRETRDESDQIIATTAYGLTPDMARELYDTGLNAAIISLDHYEADKHNKFRGNKKAFDMAVNGVGTFRENGIIPSIAICATKELFKEDGLYKYLELAKEIGAAFVQVLDATPSGNYMGRNVMLSKQQLDEIRKFHETANSDPAYKDYPAVQARAFMEHEEFYGCCAGNALVYVDSSGNLQGCDLLQISLGNLLEEDTGAVYDRMREYFPGSTKGRCPAQTCAKQIAEAHKKTGELPVSWKDAEHILRSIRDRGLPDHLKKIQQKRERKTLKDFFTR